MIFTLSLSKLLIIQVTITKSVSIMNKVRPGLVGTTGISVMDKKGAFQRAHSPEVKGIGRRHIR